MTNEKTYTLAFVDPRSGRPTVIAAPIKGWWEPVYGMPCEFCRRTLNQEEALFQPPIGMICRKCTSDVFGDVT